MRLAELGPPDFAEFFLPTWTPGSYLVREFARHLGPLIASDSVTGHTLQCQKSSKNRYRVQVPPTTQVVRLDYSVYAHDLSVRTADLTSDHAYWNHACVLLWPVNGRSSPARIRVSFPQSWTLVCQLEQVHQQPGEVVLLAGNLDAAMDAPCLAGNLHLESWNIRGIEHVVAIDGLGPLTPPSTMRADITALVEQAAGVFGGNLPYERYLFLCMLSDRGHGGLEHSHSTTLLGKRTALRTGKQYKDFLSLAVHEVFHAWNVKRMRPREFWAYDYEGENYTRMLWLIEGITAYYDDLLCRRAGIIDDNEYLAIIAKNISQMLSGVGRHRQSLAEASFDAWIRFYRPDEDTRNSTQNYYVNGAVVALLLDLEIRAASDGRRCLDDAMRQLYESTFEAGRGYDRDDVIACLGKAAGRDLGGLLTGLVEGALEVDVRAALSNFGIAMLQTDTDKPFLGLSLEEHSTCVSGIMDGGPAASACLAPSDEILALNGIRVTLENWGDVLASIAKIGEPLALLTSSRGLVCERMLTPISPPVGSLALSFKADCSPKARQLRDGWLPPMA